MARASPTPFAVTSRRNRFYGLDGPDLLVGRTGDDVLEGDAGDDVLVGRRGADRLDPANNMGDDTLRGDRGHDLLNARDHVRGNDSADGGRGDDRCPADVDDSLTHCES